MESRYVLSCILLFLLFGLATPDIAKDKEKCANDLVGLATCLPYVSGDAKVPPLDCCTGLKQVLQRKRECICILVKDRNDPSLGLKINATLALSLPSQCHTPANISECPVLLHLAPNSPDAKVFEDFANSAKQGNKTASADVKGSPAAKATSADQKNDGGQIRSSLGFEMASGLVLTMVLYSLFNV